MIVTKHVVADALRQQAQALPHTRFVECVGSTYTYGEMDSVTDAVAAGLAEIGIVKGDRVAFISVNRPEMLEMMFGCAKIGAVQVPLNAFLRGEFLRYQLQDSAASTIVVDSAGYQAVLPVLDGLRALERVIVLDDVPGTHPKLEAVPYQLLRSSRATVPDVNVTPDDLMSILYTSGTTGMPKGCMLPNGYYIHIGAGTSDIWDVRSEDVIFTTLPLFHAAARAAVTVAALLQGASAVIDAAFSASTILDRLIDTQATILCGAGMMGVAMLSQPRSLAESALRLRIAGLVPFTAEMQEQFLERFGTACASEAYGQTELTPISYSRAKGPSKPGTAGRPAPYNEVKIVDDDDIEVAQGDIGEIVVRPNVPFAMFRGYWNQPAETVKSWRNLWHHTGDYGLVDEDGFIVFVDRKKDALRRRGENVSSIELEMALVQHPDIIDAAVFAVPSPLTEDDIKACIVLREEAVIDAAQLFDFFKNNLPYFAIPRYFEVLESLPRNASERVMKHILRDLGVTPATVDLESLGFTVPSDERR